MCWVQQTGGCSGVLTDTLDGDDDAIDIENPADWVTQGFKLAKTVAYAPPVFADSAGSSPRKLDSAYSAKATATMKAQLLLAGYRLADLLKNYLN